MYTRTVYGKHNSLYNYSEFIVDSEDELPTLPTTTQSGKSGANEYSPCAVGSKAYVIETRKSYILSNSGSWKVWVNYSAQSGSSGGIAVEDDGDGNVSIL